MASDVSNPLLSPSALPYELPDYAAIRPEHYLPAFDEGFAAQRTEIDAIATDAEAPTFENTLIALERSGELLDRVAHTFYTVSSADATPEIQEIEETLAPLMAAHQDAIQLDGRLFDRITAILEQIDDLDLNAEQRFLVERHHREMSHAGAGLDDESKDRLTALNQRLSVLTTTFEKNLLADTNDLAVIFDDPTELDGLTEGEISAAAQAATDRGREGFVCDHTDAVHRASVPLGADRPEQSPPDHGGLAIARQPGQRERQRCHPRRDRAAAGRARRAARVRVARGLHHGRRDGGLARGRARAAATPRGAGGPQRGAGTGGVAGARGCRGRTVPDRGSRLGVLHREGPRRELRHRHRGSAPVVRGRARSPGRRLLRGGAALRRAVRRTPRPGGLSPRGPCLRGAERGRLPRRPVRARSVHAGFEARRGVDELDRLPVGAARHARRRREQPECAEARRGTADPADARRGDDPVPRVRSRAAWAVRDRHLPALRGDQRSSGLRRVPEPGQRDVDPLARGPAQLRPPCRDGRAAPRRHRRPAALDRDVQPGVRHERVPRRILARSGMARALGARRGRRHVRVGLRERGADEHRARSPRRAAAVRLDLFRPRLRRRLQRRVLLLHMERGARRRHRAVVPYARGLRRDNGDRFRQRLLGVGGSMDPLEAYRDFRGRDADIQPLLSRRGLDA